MQFNSISGRIPKVYVLLDTIQVLHIYSYIIRPSFIDHVRVCDRLNGEVNFMAHAIHIVLRVIYGYDRTTTVKENLLLLTTVSKHFINRIPDRKILFSGKSDVCGDISTWCILCIRNFFYDVLRIHLSSLFTTADSNVTKKTRLHRPTVRRFQQQAGA